MISLISDIIQIVGFVVQFRDTYLLNTASGKALLLTVELIRETLSPLLSVDAKTLPKHININLNATKTTFDEIKKLIINFNKKTFVKRMKKVVNVFAINSKMNIFVSRLNKHIGLISVALNVHSKGKIDEVIAQGKYLINKNNALEEQNVNCMLEINRIIRIQGENFEKNFEKQHKFMAELEKKGPDIVGKGLAEKVDAVRVTLSQNDPRFKRTIRDIVREKHSGTNVIDELTNMDDAFVKAEYKYACEQMPEENEFEIFIKKYQVSYEDLQILAEPIINSGSVRVFKANYQNDEDEQKQVAVKIFKLENDSMRDKFKKEVENLTKLNSEFVVNLLGICCIQGYDEVGIVTGFVECGTLANLDLKKKSPEDKAFMIKSLIAAVNFLHSNSFVHSKLLPENILVKTDNSVVLGGIKSSHDIDLDISNTMQEVDLDKNKIYYIIPGLQVKDNVYDRASEIYVLGLLVIKIVLGVDPKVNDANGVGLNMSWLSSFKYVFDILANNLYSKVTKCLKTNSLERIATNTLYQWSCSLTVRSPAENYQTANELCCGKIDNVNEEAMEYYKSASATGDLKAITNIALCKLYGTGGHKKDVNCAVTILEATATKHARAAYALSELFGKPNNGFHLYDPKKAVIYAKFALSIGGEYIDSNRSRLKKNLDKYKSLVSNNNGYEHK